MEPCATYATARSSQPSPILLPRITPALRMKVEDLRPKGAGWEVQLHEKGGKQHAMPCHHTLAEMLRAYIDAAGNRRRSQGLAFGVEVAASD
jgi:hypothetical protein